MIYLDHNATTPIPREVFEAMVPFLTEGWGNPSSSYGFGARIRSSIAEARASVSTLIGAKRGNVVFTSGGTEANNAILQSVLSQPVGSRHIVTTSVEHPSVIETVLHLQRFHGVKVTLLPVNEDGSLDMDSLQNAVQPGVSLVSVMWANNETGVIFPIEAIGALCRDREVPFHTDASQIAGKMAIETAKLPVDYLTITGHKFGAPKGIGAIYISRGAAMSPLLHGGHQEQGLRGGTEAVAPIAALGTAAQIASKSLGKYEDKVRPLRDKLENAICDLLPSTVINGVSTLRLANTSNLSFPKVASEALLLLLDQQGVCASSGSACMALSDEPSHVIHAMAGAERARTAVRFSIGIATSQTDIDHAVSAVLKAVSTLRGS